MIKETRKQRFKRWLVNQRNYRKIKKREKEIFRKLPYTCATCEVLGLCRDEMNDWKCINGCWFIEK